MELYLPPVFKPKGRFQKGNIPWNKGKIHNMPNEDTRFKKGCRPYHHVPIGTERFRPGRGWAVKVAEPNQWRQKSHIIYESFYGPILPGHVIKIIDGNMDNLEIDNLMMVTKEQILKLNLNRKKAAETLKNAYKIERIRKKYDLPPVQINLHNKIAKSV